MDHDALYIQNKQTLRIFLSTMDVFRLSAFPILQPLLPCLSSLFYPIFERATYHRHLFSFAITRYVVEVLSILLNTTAFLLLRLVTRVVVQLPEAYVDNGGEGNGYH